MATLAENTAVQPPSVVDTQLLSAEFMARLNALSLVSKKILAGKLRGERRSRKRGDSLEFADYRPYSQGDDLRRIDWNLYGRLERLFLKTVSRRRRPERLHSRRRLAFDELRLNQ